MNEFQRGSMFPHSSTRRDLSLSHTHTHTHRHTHTHKERVNDRSRSEISNRAASSPYGSLHIIVVTLETPKLLLCLRCCSFRLPPPRRRHSSVRLFPKFSTDTRARPSRWNSIWQRRMAGFLARNDRRRLFRFPRT